MSSGSECVETVSHMQRMDEYRTAKMVLMAEVSEGQVRDRPRLGLMV